MIYIKHFIVYNIGMKKNLPVATEAMPKVTWLGKELYDMTPTEIRGVQKRILKMWEMAMPDLMVVEYAKITEAQYKHILDHFPEFADMRAKAYTIPNIKARMNIMKDLDKGNVSTSKWYLEKTDPQFSKKSIRETNVTVSVSEREKQLLENMQQYGTADFTVIEEEREPPALGAGQDT